MLSAITKNTYKIDDAWVDDVLSRWEREAREMDAYYKHIARMSYAEFLRNKSKTSMG